MRLKLWLASIAIGASLPIVHGADLVGKITLKGSAPPPEEVMLDKLCQDASGTNRVVISDFAVGVSNALAGVVVFIKETPPGAAARTEPVVFDRKGCVYNPY